MMGHPFSFFIILKLITNNEQIKNRLFPYSDMN